MKIFLHADDFGRSPKISNSIFDSITKGKINSVSVMVDEITPDHEKLKKIKNLKMKLHLNLTEKKYFIYKDDKKIVKEFNFITLIFASKKWRKVILQEINEQIKRYANFYDLEEIIIDGHEHAHIIPWVYREIASIDYIKIKEVRWPYEKIIDFKLSHILNKRFIRNLIVVLLVKIILLFNKKYKFQSPIFFGLLYSDLYNKNILNSTIKSARSMNKDTEILLHPGHTDETEKGKFKNRYYKFYSSNQRINEKELTYNINI